MNRELQEAIALAIILFICLVAYALFDGNPDIYDLLLAKIKLLLQ